MNDKLKQFYSENSNRNLQMSADAQKRVKENIFSRLRDGVQQSPAPISVWEKISTMFLRSYVLVPLVILLFIAGGTYTTYASSNSLPGDILYPVKLQVENVRILVAPSEEAKLELQEQFTKKRVEELEKVRNTIPVVTNENEKKERKESENDKKKKQQEFEQESKSNERKERARDEAAKAIEKLRESRKTWEGWGNNDKAKEIDEKVEEFKQRVESRHNTEDQGEVRGIFDNLRSIDRSGHNESNHDNERDNEDSDHRDQNWSNWDR